MKNYRRIFCMLLAAILMLSCAALAETKTYKAIGSSDHQTDFNETSALMGTLEELTGIHLDWTIFTSQGREEQLQLVLSNEDYWPDVFTNSATIDTAKYSQEGVLYDITDLIEENMPNYMAALEEFPDIMERTRQADGRIYSLPRVTPYYKTGGAMYINVEWLEQLGKEMPTTTEELYEILCAFRDNDMNGNGDATDEIPFTWLNTRADYGTNAFFGIFGEEAAGVGTMDLCIDDDGEVYMNRATDGYKEGIKYLAKLYAENRIDPEVFTQDEATFNAKSMGDTLTYGAFVGWRVGQIVGDANADKYAVVPPLKHGDAEPSWGMLSSTFGMSYTPHNAQFSSKLAEEDVVALLKYFDILFDPWYGEQVRRGTVPELMFFDEATGQFGMNPTPSEFSSSTEWQRSRAIQFLPAYSSMKYQDGFKTTASVIQLYAKDDVYGDYIKVKNLPHFIMDAEDSLAVSKIKSDLELYMNEKFALWVSGAEDVETGWEAYLDQCDTYGLQTWIDMSQDYIDELAE